MISEAISSIEGALRENLYQFYSLREKVFTIEKIIFKSKNRVFKVKKQLLEPNIFFLCKEKFSQAAN